MLIARAFCMTRRRAGFEAGSEPPDFTAIVMSLPMRANCFAMRFHRANIACFLTSKIRPIGDPTQRKWKGRDYAGNPEFAEGDDGSLRDQDGLSSGRTLRVRKD